MTRKTIVTLEIEASEMYTEDEILALTEDVLRDVHWSFVVRKIEPEEESKKTSFDRIIEREVSR